MTSGPSGGCIRFVTGYPRPEVVAEVEQAWRNLFPSHSEDNIRGILDFEMQSVELPTVTAAYD